MNILHKQAAFSIITGRRESAIKTAETNLAIARGNEEFLQFDREVRRLTIEIAKKTSQNINTKDEEKALNAAYAARLHALKKSGLILEDLSPRYFCKLCGDTGYKTDKLCSCANKLLNKIIAESCGMGSLPKATFSDFNALIYPEGRQRDEIEKLYKLMRDYCGKFPDTKYRNLTCIGATGLGKTQLLCSVANALINKGKDVLYLTAFGLNNLMLKAHTIFDENRAHILDGVLEAELLIIDDLGTEPVYKNVTEEYLLSIIKERTLNGLHTFISTNLNLEQLNAKYGTRLISRLADKSNSFLYELSGNDLRHRK